MGLLATFELVEMDGLTLGLNRHNLPITGVAISTSLKRSKPEMRCDVPESPASRQESSMDDADSLAANVDITPPPVQIHQLATILWNIPNNDREANLAIIERLEDPDNDLTRHPVQIFSAADLAHLASHLAESTRNLSDQANQMEALSDISD